MARSTRRLKTSSGMSSYWSVLKVLNSDDIMFEILLRLSPDRFFYKLILVSKRWAQIISNPFFRHIYLTKWNPSSPPPICFCVCSKTYLGSRVDVVRRPRNEPSLPILSTSSIGRQIKSSGVLKNLGYYIDSSNGLLLSGRHPNDYCLWDPCTQKKQQLPRPRVYFKELCMSLITEDCPYNYKVIRAECVGNFGQSPKVRVEIFSSKSTTWSSSELTCPESTALKPWNPGRVIKGVVYWYAIGGKVAIYDSNSEEKRIDLIEFPNSQHYDEHVLGETADGCLQYGRSNKLGMIVWKLEKVNNVLQWNVMFKLNFEAMWNLNPEEDERFSTLTKETQLLAFLNQRSDSVYIRCETKIFIYDTNTQCVEVVQYPRRKAKSDWKSCKVLPLFRRTWPSCFCLKTMS